METNRIKVSLANLGLTATLSKDGISANLNKPQQTSVSLQGQTTEVSLTRNTLNANLSSGIMRVETQNHKYLQGLSFEESGHTGFASEKQLSILREETVPKRLDQLGILPTNVERSKVMLYADYGEQSYRVSMGEIGTQIKTVSSVPTDMKVGDYIFLKKE